MRLVKFTLHGYKRFRDESKLKIESKLTAIVGPNESGKSSILQALEHLNHSNAFDVSPEGMELTRNTEIPSDQRVIEALFLIEESDREALKEFPEAQSVHSYSLYKHPFRDTIFFEFSPNVDRDFSLRQRAIKSLNKSFFDTQSPEGLDGFFTEEFDKVVRGAIENLESESYSLDSEILQSIQSIQSTLENLDEESRSGFEETVRSIAQLLEYEARNVRQEAGDILYSRRPKMLPFSSADRSLERRYSLLDDETPTDTALNNLARVADLNLEGLRNALQAVNVPLASTILTRANRKLDESFRSEWSQSDLRVTLALDGTNLEILITQHPDAHDEEHTSIADRSDGFRQFVALYAFIKAQSEGKNTYLLIDEAETHLHYDAQADLIQMLARQNLAEKIIYTTHSVGCLPEDLGTGVRVVKSHEPASFTSSIENSFWTSDRPGFPPLLFGMGASTLAFFPIRNSVIAEGPSDMILWPTILREGIESECLDFQITPGISSANKEQIIVLDNEAQRTVYLLDSDSGGGNLKQQILDAGVDENRILRITNDPNKEIVLEDLINSEIYLVAVNEELQVQANSTRQVPDGYLGDVNRPAKLALWCTENDLEEPSKTAVAYRILELGRESGLLDPRHTDMVRGIFESITKELHRED